MAKQKTDLEVFQEWVQELKELVFGTSNKFEGMIGPKNFTLDDGAVEKPKRARTKKGTYKGDDKSTKDVNEAWVGGKAPTRKELLGLKKKKAKRKTKRKK